MSDRSPEKTAHQPGRLRNALNSRERSIIGLSTLKAASSVTGLAWLFTLALMFCHIGYGEIHSMTPRFFGKGSSLCQVMVLVRSKPGSTQS